MKSPMPDTSLTKLQAYRTAALLKRDSNTGFFLWILRIISEHLFRRGSTNGWKCFFWRTHFFKEHIQWLLLTVSGLQPATWSETRAKRLRRRCLSVNLAKFLKTSFDRTSPDDCFLWLSANFGRSFRPPFLQLFYTIENKTSTNNGILLREINCSINQLSLALW